MRDLVGVLADKYSYVAIGCPLTKRLNSHIPDGCLLEIYLAFGAI